MLKNLSVLLVEDDLEIRSIMEEYLEDLVESVYIAKDGKEGLDKFFEHSPNIVISDINMPNLDGIEMAKKIKQHSQETKVVITSAHSNNYYKQKAIEVGVDKYLTKPIQLNEIHNILEG